MMPQKTITPIFAILLSFIPGLPAWIFGKRREAALTWMALGFTTVLFFLLPSLITWYPVCLVFLGQMVYNAALAVWHSPDKESGKTISMPKRAAPLPERFKPVKSLDRPVREALIRDIGPDSTLVTVILGLDTACSQYKFFGVTAEDLVVADCTAHGDSQNSMRIPKAEVAWVFLSVGESGSQMTIEFEAERYPKVALEIPGTLRNQAFQFAKEFPGTWETDMSIVDAMTSVRKLGWRPHVVAILLISGGLIIFGAAPPRDDPVLGIVKFLSITLGFFLLPWPYVLWLLRETRKAPALTWATFARAFSTLPLTLFMWGMAVSPLGKVIISILKGGG